MMWFCVQVFAITQTDNTVEGVTLQSLGWLLQPSTPEKEPPVLLFDSFVYFAVKILH
jgi:hypothetical protein